jgi:Cu/Ag efflux protein CusF
LKFNAYPAAPAEVKSTDPPSQKVVIAPEAIDGLELVTTGMNFIVAITADLDPEVQPFAVASA